MTKKRRNGLVAPIALRATIRRGRKSWVLLLCDATHVRSFMSIPALS